VVAYFIAERSGPGHFGILAVGRVESLSWWPALLSTTWLVVGALALGWVVGSGCASVALQLARGFRVIPELDDGKRRLNMNRGTGRVTCHSPDSAGVLCICS